MTKSNAPSPDLTYTSDGLFTSFYAETKAGEIAWRELATATDGTAKVLVFHTASTVQQLRDAGYVVRESKREGISDDDLLRSLGA